MARCSAAGADGVSAAQPRGGVIRAHTLKIGEALTADELTLGQAHHQLTRRGAAPANLHWRSSPLHRQLGVDQLNQPQPPGELTSDGQPREADQRRVTLADLDPSAARGRVNRRHPLGDSTHIPWQVSAPRQTSKQIGRKARSCGAFPTQEPLTALLTLAMQAANKPRLLTDLGLRPKDW